MTRTATIQPDVRRFSSIRPQPRVRVTCPAYIGDRYNTEGKDIANFLNFATANGVYDVQWLRDRIAEHAALAGKTVEQLGLGVVYA